VRTRGSRSAGGAAESSRKIEAATSRLRELDQAKTDFLSVVSHELRTPLTALQGFSELLLRSALPPEKAHRCLVYLHTEACTLGRIVGELLDLSRIEAGRALELHPETVDLDALLERNIELFATEHRQHRSPGPPPASRSMPTRTPSTA
jgi:signal transduction histidine kinase